MSGLSSGIYTVSVSDQDGCMIEGEAFVLEGRSPIHSSSILPICSATDAFGRIDLTLVYGARVVRPLNYLWDTGETTEDLSNISTPGTYCVTITDNCGVET